MTFEVKTVNFEGSDLVAAKDTTNNKIYVGVSWVCNGMGMTKTQKDHQVENIQKNFTLKRGCRLLPAGVINEHNQALTIELDFLPLWLAKINITSNMQEETPELANKILEFQLKAKDILASAFFKNVNPNTMSRIELIEYNIELFTQALIREKEIVRLQEENDLKTKLLEKYNFQFDEGLVYASQVASQFGIGVVKFSDFLKKLCIVADTEKTVYYEYSKMFRYTDKYISTTNEFIQVLKVNTDGVVFLEDLLVNGISSIKSKSGVNWSPKEFDKLRRKEISDFVDVNMSVFQPILDKYRKPASSLIKNLVF